MHSQIRASLAALAVVASFFAFGPAVAHTPDLVSSIFRIGEGRIIAAEITMKGSDVDRAIGTKIHDNATDKIIPDALTAATPTIMSYLAQRAVVSGADGTACQTLETRLLVEGDALTTLVKWNCAATKGDLVYRSTLLTHALPAARQIVVVGDAVDASQAMLTKDVLQTNLIGEKATLLEVALDYIWSGIEHIFIGFDHIAFIVAVLLWARSFVSVVKIVTAFTVAHSITLSLAVLGYIDIPGSIIEPLIAASIVMVAAENFFSRNIDRKWKYTFVLGLIHGFGFASVLKEFGLPQDALVVALATFNIGVEIGQIAIVCIALPITIALGRMVKDWRFTLPRPLTANLMSPDGTMTVDMRTAAVVYATSATIGLLGLYWLIERTLLD